MKHKNDKSMHNMIQPRAFWLNGLFGALFNSVSHLTIEGEKKSMHYMVRVLTTIIDIWIHLLN